MKFLHGNLESIATSATSGNNSVAPKLTFIHVDGKTQ